MRVLRSMAVYEVGKGLAATILRQQRLSAGKAAHLEAVERVTIVPRGRCVPPPAWEYPACASKPQLLQTTWRGNLSSLSSCMLGVSSNFLAMLWLPSILNILQIYSRHLLCKLLNKIVPAWISTVCGLCGNQDCGVQGVDEDDLHARI